MKILYPEVFWLFIPLGLLLLPAVFNYRRSRKGLQALAGAWRGERSVRVSFLKNLIYWITILLFFLFSILALAGISWGKTTLKDESAGLDLVVAADISRSMLAEDVSPSRLSLGGEGLSSVLNALDSFRAAVVVFKGKGEVLVPLTEDRILLESALRSLSPDLYTVPGSDLEAGLRSALEAFPPGSPGRKVILLVTDGESLTGRPREAAREAYLQQIPLLILGTGAPEGVILKDREGGILKDRNGQPVVSRLEEDLLKELAALTGGGYYNLSDPRSLGQVSSALEKLLSTQEGAGILYRDQPQFRFFLLLALGFLLLNVFLNGIRWSKWF